MQSYFPSQKGLVLLKDAAASPVEVVACEPRHNCRTQTVRRLDGRGLKHQVRTLNSLVQAGLMAATGLVYVPTVHGLAAIGALAS